MDKFEYKGYWFLPEAENKSIAGILTYIAHESIILELIGESCDDDSMINIFLNRSHRQLIYVVTSDAKKISLINCTPSGFNFNPSCNFPLSRYSVQYVFENIHIDKCDDNLFDKAVVTIDSLTKWCYPGALHCSMSTENDKPVDVGISYNVKELKSPISTVQISDTTTINLCRNIDFVGSEYLLSPKFEQFTQLEIQKLLFQITCLI